MILTIERRNFHVWNKETGIVNFPNRFELRSDDGKKFLGIFTAKRNTAWHLGINISLTDSNGVNRTLTAPCSFKVGEYLSEGLAFSAQLQNLRKSGVKLPKSWWKQLDFYLRSLYAR